MFNRNYGLKQKGKLKKKSSRFGSWTIMLMGKASQPVLQFKVPKLFFYISLACILAFAGFSSLSYYTSAKLQHENSVLSEDLAELQDKHQLLTKEAIEVQAKINELKTLEHQMKRASDLLNLDQVQGDDPEPKGGIEVSQDGEVHSQLNSEKTASRGGLGVKTRIPSLLGQYEALREELPLLIESYEDTLSDMEVLQEEIKVTPTFWPSESTNVTSPFGNRQDPFTRRASMHTGIDIAGPYRSSIFAAGDGEVVYAGYHGGYGNTVLIRHSSEYTTRYAHMTSLDVTEGEKITKGETIGYMGSTGRSTGVHLHFEVWKKGEPIDPYPYVTLFGD